MATLRPATASTGYSLQASEGSPCNQPVHPGSGPPDR